MFDLDQLCFMDTETKALAGTPPDVANLKISGGDLYTAHAFVVILTYAIGNGPVQCVAMDEGFDEDGMRWRDMPDDLRAFHDRVERGEGFYVAWNMGFDRQAWYRGTFDFPKLKVDWTLDAMAQAVASNLPPDLNGASTALKLSGKMDEGKDLIALFTKENAPQPHEHPEEWERFKTYAIRDTDQLRRVWQATRPLPLQEWEEYWASEDINERGMPVDVGFARRAMALSDVSVGLANARLKQLTNGVIDKVTQRERITNWVWEHLPSAEARDIMIKAYSEDDEGGWEVSKLGLDRGRIEQLIAYLQANRSPGNDQIEEMLSLRLWGGSTAPAKFARVIERANDGILRGSFVLNGAAQTGRFSSRGVQTHNMVRKSLGGKEVEAIEFINALEL